MNKQSKGINSRGIEWTDWTWNPTGGCFHGCTWEMPDGSIAECYAKTIAERMARSSYVEGFEHHYWREYALNDPLKEKLPAKIFVGSMADLFGHWVPEEQIKQILETMRQADWHTFQTLSKYPIRLPEFNAFPDNVWVGVSLPAGHLLSKKGAPRALEAYLRQMTKIQAKIRFMSLEPLWFDVGKVLKEWVDKTGKLPIEWVIIGAASNGRKTYQPEPEWVESVLEVLDALSIPVFFKGNLKWKSWREEFPESQTNLTRSLLLSPSY